MATHVGGRMEAVAPIRVTDTSDRVRLIALVLISLGLHGWLVANSAMTARDSLGFARLGMNLAWPAEGKPKLIPGNPESEAIARTLPTVLRDAQQPPAYPSTVFLTFAALKRIDPPPAGTNGVSPNRLLRAAQIAAAGAMILAVFPMYWLGRMLLDKNRAVAAVLLFQFLPVCARDTSDGLSEGLYFLGLSSALALGVAGIRKQSIGRSLLCGFACGFTYLVRPEGLAVGIAAVAVCVLLALVHWRPRGHLLGCALAVLVGTGCAAAPYMLLIGGLTNKPSGKQAIEGVPVQGSMRPGMGVAPALFAEIDTAVDRGTPLERAGHAVTTMALEYLHASHYILGGLGVFGLVLMRKQFRTHPEWWLLAATALVHLLALAKVAYSQGYASERHLLTTAFAATYFAMGGLPILFEWLKKWPFGAGLYRTSAGLWIWTAVLVGICIPSLTRPLHQNRIQFKEAGEFLAKEMGPDDRITDPYEWSQFYTGQTIYRPPQADYRPDEYVILRANADAEDRRLNQSVVEYAKIIIADTRTVQIWPLDATGKSTADAKVKVYRLSRSAFGSVIGPMVCFR